ncbi:lipid droplet-regulating VLDL assembly factor AUP1-like [Achroia grisella]|uniref:lipid droplet-regulating VLDL assembly factor AUP1-like n=1 Tax=Achroia grisella TaxID=688607 RepID=UPI0027D28D1B|nr:lipid droplet-regulating VLDL assembly factor AUP1-like [Achroia grisella]
MALTVDKLKNDDRFCGDNVFQFLLYLPFGVILLAFRILLALVLWIASIILPNKSAVRQLLSTLACWTFGVYVKLKGNRDPRCSVLVSNYVSCLDSLAASHVLGTISLRKWKVPPFFASTLGIRNAAQFVRKAHFADSPSKPILLQPEGGPTNGKGLLKFTDWPFQIGNRVQPVTISVERMYTAVTVAGGGGGDRFPWSDALWFLWSPVTVFRVNLLPPLDRGSDADSAYSRRLREAIAADLGVELTEFNWEDVKEAAKRAAGEAARRRPLPAPAASPAAPAAAPAPRAGTLRAGLGMEAKARQVKEVLPAVPLADILRDLATTGSVDVTITNFLEGVTTYEPEPSTSAPAAPPAPRYVTPTPTGVFPKSAKERQLSFQERKAQMIAEARQRYIDKHGLNFA